MVESDRASTALDWDVCHCITGFGVRYFGVGLTMWKVEGQATKQNFYIKHICIHCHDLESARIIY